MKIDGVNLQILKLLSEGLTVKEIARDLKIKENKAIAIIWSLKQFFGAKNNTELVVRAIATNNLIINHV